MQSAVVHVRPAGAPAGLVVHVYLTVPTVFFALAGAHLVPYFTAAAFAGVMPEITSATAARTGAHFLTFFNMYYSS